MEKQLITTYVDFTPKAKIENAFYFGRILKSEKAEHLTGIFADIIRKIEETGYLNYEFSGSETMSGNPLVVSFNDTEFIMKHEWQ